MEAIVAYGAFEQVDKGSFEASCIATGADLDSVKTGINEFRNNNDNLERPQQENQVDVESEVGRGIWTFYTRLKSFYEIADVIEVIPAAFVSSFFKKAILSYAQKNFKLVDEHEGVPIYALTEYDLSHLTKQNDRWNSISDGFNKLPASILLSLVAGFDSAFSDFAKVLLKSKPERYSGSERQYSVSEILKLDSLEQIVSKAADDEIDQLMNKSHVDQVSFFEKSFDISIKDHYERWPSFVEIFERRNLVAHGSLRVNTRYLDNCKKAGLETINAIGNVLVVDGKYLESSIDVLIEFGMLLALSAWQKQYPKSVLESFGAVVEVSYSLLKDNHPNVAARLLEYGLKVKSKGADEEKTKMMIINLAIAYRQTGNDSKATALIDRTDWSASPSKFKLCAFAVKGDVQKSLTLLEAARVSDDLSIAEIREWPAFQWVRGDEAFKRGCEQVFGELVTPVRLISDKNQTDSIAEPTGDPTPPPPAHPQQPAPATAPDTAP